MKLLFSIFINALVILFPLHSQNQFFGQTRDILIENIDTSVNPAMDFFSYANGGWIKKNSIPADESRWGIGNLVNNETLDRMKKLSEEAASDVTASIGSNTQKIGDFYFAAMDTITIEQQGISKLKVEFDKINSINDKKSLIETIAHMQMIGSSPLFGMFIYQDSKNSEKEALYFWQGGIGLPDRDYYFNTDQRTKTIREEYLKHLSKMFQLLGDNIKTADKNAKIVMKIETDLAKASKKLEDLRDPYANYNKMNINEFDKLNPSMKWKETLRTMDIAGIDTVIVAQPEFYKEVEKVLKTISIDEWKAYLRWNLINTFAANLNKSFDEQNFNFYSRTLAGTEKQRPTLEQGSQDTGKLSGRCSGTIICNEILFTFDQKNDMLTLRRK